MRGIVVILLGILIQGCSLLNTLFEERKVFEMARESEIGKSLEWVIEHSAHYYFYNIENEIKGPFSQQYRTVDLNESHTQYEFNHGKNCKWFLLVNKETKKIESWEYAHKHNDCAYKRFYEGPF